MQKGSDFNLEFQAKSSADLLRKYKVKLENAKASKISKECISNQELKKSSTLNQGKNQQPVGSIQKHSSGHSQTICNDGGSIQKVDQRKKSLTIGGVAVQVTGSTPMHNNKQDQRKQSLNNRAASQTTGIDGGNIQKLDQKKQTLTIGEVAVQVTGSTQMQNKKQDQRKQGIETTEVSHQKGLVKSTTIVQPDPPKKINVQSKEFCDNNNLKRQLRSTMGNQSQGTMEEEQPSKKNKYIPKCPAMPLDEYINKQQHEVEESEDGGGEGNGQEQGVEGDINYESEDVEEINENTSEGAASKRKRGKTLCVKIHTRSPDDREEIILNEEGQPIGPNERIVSQFSSFLGTIARSSDLCPLIYTNWKAIPEKDKNIWGYVNKKYIVSEKGKKAVYAIINDAWRRYKCSIKKKHFSKYKNLRERLKNRPEDIPEEHFRKLMEYWRIEAIQEISVQNAQNIAQQKWRHRAGPISFARIRERMCASKEDGESPSQAEMFIETRQSKKGKELDTETSDAIIKLQDLVSLGQSSSEAFQNVLGKEKPGRVRCHGRTTTATILKKNEEIAEIKRAYANEVEQLKEAHACEMRELKDQNQKFQQGMEDKFQLLIKAMLNQSNSRPNLEALVALLSTPPDANSALRSSTSTHAPNNHEEPDDDMDDGHLLDGHLLDDLEVEVDEDLS